ncbi:MAG: hypothetical protein WD098_01880 [Balneolales bacterium]
MEEVYLSFRYRGVGDVMVIAIYENGEFYLPVTELFNLLLINHNVEMTGNQLLVKGFYLDENDQYEIDFNNNFIRMRNVQREILVSEQLIGELDFYLLPQVFADIFDLDFSVNMNNLRLQLETNKTMPVVNSMERKAARGSMREYQVVIEDYPLIYGRNSQKIGGAFLDYSISGNVSNAANIYNYNFTGGAELLGGDIQGSILGTMSGDRHYYRTGNMRWRYIFQDRPWITRFALGQLDSEGLVNRSYQGVHISNDPVEPRRLYDEYRIQGLTAPQSEIEIYLNNRLIEYSVADELGNYDFSIPLTYGNARLKLMMYNPDGSISEQNQRLQIPYTFLPTGEINYVVNAGLTDNPVIPGDERNMMVHSNAAYGLTNWLTGKGGIEYLKEANMKHPLVYSSFSARIATQYLVNVDLAPDAYYRFRTSIIYPNNIGWGIGYTNYTHSGGIYNRSGNDQDIQANLFMPLSIKKHLLGIRFTGTHRILTSGSTNTQFRSDINTRLYRANIRIGYRETISNRAGNTISSDGNLSSSATYTIPRRSSFPKFFAGTFFRTRLDYRMRMSRFERLEAQISKTVGSIGRILISFERNFIGSFNTVEAGVTFDFNSTRTASTARFSRGSSSLRNSLRGSVGIDTHHKRILFNNRQQVGRSAASVRMFIDNNSSGDFDEGDEIIPDNAIRLIRAGTRNTDSEGIHRITQLPAYQRHNLEINQSAIKNPSLIPKIMEFSFIGDPNSYKTIDIPFYIAGIIEGGVTLVSGEDHTPLGGMRINLRQLDGNYESVMRTFSDGGYYAMEIPPGRYEATVDQGQLKFLNARSEPEVLEFDVVTQFGGDYVGDLNFKLIETSSLVE